MKNISWSLLFSTLALIAGLTSLGLNLADQADQSEEDDNDGNQVAFADYRKDDWKRNYYESEVATLQSPHGLRLSIDRGEDLFLIVDVRTPDFYEAGHIVGAINIPGDLGGPELLEQFRQLEANNRGKQIVTYCYSTSCMNGRKIGEFLAENGVFVKELTIGYNEWAQVPELWNYPNEVYDISDYIVTGSEPGEYEPTVEVENHSCGNSAFVC